MKFSKSTLILASLLLTQSAHPFIISTVNGLNVVDKLPLDVQEWDCPHCGAYHDRDINTAKNILAAGHVVNACGGDVRPKRFRAWRQSSVKQETPEVTGRIPRL